MLELDIYGKVAESLGKGISAERVLELARATTAGEHIVHGVKYAEAVDKIASDGIKPLTPEGGWVSYWTSGLRMFTATDNPNSSLFGYDSSIFQYTNKAIILTNRDLLSKCGISFSRWDGQAVTIDKAIPRRAVALLGIKPGLGKNIPRAAFELLEKVIRGGYKGGETFRG